MASAAYPWRSGDGIPTKCPRCGGSMAAYSMSRFNNEMICSECIDDERQAPGYAAAAEAEIAAVKRGDYNFPGVGLSAADREFLAARRAGR